MTSLSQPEPKTINMLCTPDARVNQLRGHLRRVGRHQHAAMRAPAEVAAAAWLLCGNAALPLAQSVLREVWQ